jgi:hypothetical protein
MAPIYWKNPETYLGTIQANIDGTFTVTVPAGAPTGLNTVLVYGSEGQGTLARASFTVQ